MNIYQRKLLTYVNNDGFFKTTVDSEIWRDLSHFINQSVLDDAHSKSAYIVDLYKPLKLVTRSVKKMSRIVIKKTETKNYMDFKLNSDFIAFRIVVEEPSNISSVVDKLYSITREIGGKSIILTDILDENKEPIDIIQYVYVYIPTIGYVMEFQIGHPFAMYTFKIDSQIRDLKNNDQPYQHIADLWTYDFYNNIKKKIIDPSYSYDVKTELKKVYSSDKNPPSRELIMILSSFLLNHFKDDS
jgi:hypothetical protein